MNEAKSNQKKQLHVRAHGHFAEQGNRKRDMRRMDGKRGGKKTFYANAVRYAPHFAKIRISSYGGKKDNGKMRRTRTREG